MPTETPIVVGHYSSQGTRPRNVDAARWHTYHGNAVLAAAVVDGSGNSDELAALAPVWAEIATRVSARVNGVAGILACTETVRDPIDEFPLIDGVMVVVVCRPGEPSVVTYVGDCRAYGYQDAELRQLTEDHTKGQRMRHHGAADELAARADMVPVASIARATVGTVALRETFAPMIVLTSDGVHAHLEHADLAQVVAAHDTDPESCAKALVEAAREAGSTDDATALVLRLAEPPVRGEASEGR